MALARKTRVEPKFSLAAMIDVIFLLLMFFMLTSKFVTPSALNLQLPSSQTTTTSNEPGMTISIDNSGRYKLNGRRTTQEKLMAAVEARMNRLGKTPSETTVAVVTEKNTPIEDVVFVLDIANKLSVKTILATDVD